MTQPRVLLVVNEHMPSAERLVALKDAAKTLGAELLQLEPGCTADLLTVPVLTEVVASEPPAYRHPHDRFSADQLDAFRVVERLLNAGEVKLVRDRWAHGALRLMPPGNQQPSALTPPLPLPLPDPLLAFVAEPTYRLTRRHVLLASAVGLMVASVAFAALHVLAGVWP